MRKYQYYDSGDDGDRDAYGVNWEGQSFTPQVDQMIASVKLKLFRVGSPGTLTVGIRLCAAGKPVGGDLCVGTIDADTLTEDTNGDWYEITLGDGYDVDIGSQYAIVIRAVDGDASNKVSWRADTSSPTYAYGTSVDSSDSGVSWSTYSGVDAMFEVWGAGPPSATTVTWGNLLKSQISSETIEEAIARLIQAHEDDADAHLEAGESLYSHKASEIIDHVVSSIIEDKLKDGAVTSDKIDVSELSAISADIGDITAGTITGVLFQTHAADHTGVKISYALGGIDVYGLSVQILDTSGNVLGTMGGSSGDFYITCSDGILTLQGLDSGVSILGPLWSSIDITESNISLNIDGTYSVWIDKTDMALMPNTDDAIDLGTSSYEWKDLYLNGTAQVDALRIDQTPTAETPDATHTITISANGTNYKLLCVAA